MNIAGQEIIALDWKAEAMAIKDWFRKAEPEPKPEPEPELKLPEMNIDVLLDQTLSALDGKEEILQQEKIEDPRPEYDAGEVEMDELLNDDETSNYEVNVVEHVDITELGDDLVDVKIIGDLPEEFDL
ncbi:MAG: hypothetical protein ACKVIR_06470 [Candidatus Poseidoniales archaeon]